MKIDKDFAVKYGEHTFRCNEIKKINISNGWFSMECAPIDGMITKLETKLENVEFLSNTPVYGLQVEEEFRCNVFGDKSRRWVVYESDKSNAESEITVEDVKQAVREYTEQMSDTPNVNVQLTSPYYKVGDEPKSDIEVVYPLERVRKTFKESIEQMGKEPINDAYNDKAKASDDAAVKAMKDAADAIGKAAEAICKAIEPMKVNLSIDSEQFSKLLKKYNQDITRSGG